MKKPVTLYILLLALSIGVLFLLNLFLGSVDIPFRSIWNILWGMDEGESVIWQNIIWKSRVPQALTAMVAGAGLAVSGLQMQTLFRNPLAGPYVLGVSSGASLGVALFILGAPLLGMASSSLLSSLGVAGAAWIGAAAITVLFYFVLEYFNTSNIVPSTISVTTSFVAVYLTFRRSPWFALAYASNDVVLIVLWIIASAEDISYLPMVFCFVAFLANDLYGFFNWRRMQREQNNG